MLKQENGFPLLTLLLPAVMLCFFSCASALPSAYTQVREIPEDYTGIVHAGGTRTQQEYELLNYLGASWILHTFYWNGIEHEQGQWDFQYYDDIVDMAAEAGIKTLGVLAYSNRYIYTSEKRKYYIPPDNIPDFVEYVRRTAEHFRGRIGAWCIWNEPNSFFWGGTDKEFFELARQAADAIREVDSEVILLGGAFNRGVFGLPKKFMAGLFESGAMEKIDALAFHPYELNLTRAVRLYDKFKKLADTWAFGDKIWITEVGFPTGGLYPTQVPEKKLSAYVIKTCTLLAIRDTRKLMWYQLFDPANRRPSNSEDFFGLVRSSQDYTSKGAEAFRLCSTYLSGTSWHAQESTGAKLPKNLSMYYFCGDDANTLILWNNGPGAIKIRAALPGTGHTRHDPVSGAATAIQAEFQIKIDSMPVFITWQGDDARPMIYKK